MQSLRRLPPPLSQQTQDTFTFDLKRLGTVVEVTSSVFRRIAFILNRMGKLKIFVSVSGNTLNSDKQFMDSLPTKHKRVKTADKCDVILLFCPIVSRVGTDIEAALKDFKDIPLKHIILVVLHHTFDRDQVVPDSRKYGGEKIHVVNCLFHEDVGGLLKKCDLNTRAVRDASAKLKEFKKEEKTVHAEQKEKKIKQEKNGRRSPKVHAEQKEKKKVPGETEEQKEKKTKQEKNGRRPPKVHAEQPIVLMESGADAQNTQQERKKKKKDCNIL